MPGPLWVRDGQGGERAGRQRVHVISSDAGRSYDPGFCCTTRVLRQDPLAAIR